MKPTMIRRALSVSMASSGGSSNAGSCRPRLRRGHVALSVVVGIAGRERGDPVELAQDDLRPLVAHQWRA